MTVVYPFFDGGETTRVVDESAVGDEPALFAAGCRRRIARCGHDVFEDFVDPRRDRRTRRTIGGRASAVAGAAGADPQLALPVWRVRRDRGRCRHAHLVFVEVKTRTSEQVGGVAEAVTPQKVRRLRRLAGLWLAGQDRAVGRRCGSTSWGCGWGEARKPWISHLQGSRLMALGRAFSVAVRGNAGAPSRHVADDGLRLRHGALLAAPFSTIFSAIPVLAPRPSRRVGTVVLATTFEPRRGGR